MVEDNSSADGTRQYLEKLGGSDHFRFLSTVRQGRASLSPKTGCLLRKTACFFGFSYDLSCDKIRMSPFGSRRAALAVGFAPKVSSGYEDRGAGIAGAREECLVIGEGKIPRGFSKKPPGNTGIVESYATPKTLRKEVNTMGDTAAIQTILIDAKNTQLIAHRGLSGIERENTLAAFVAAGNRNYFGIETDVHVTADGKFILIHDDETGRVSNAKMSVEGSDFHSLRSIVLRDRDEKPRADLHLPCLDEYLRVCNRYGKIGVLELKGRIDSQYIQQIVERVEQLYSVERMVFISFFYDNLVDLRGLLPNARIQFLCNCDVNGELCEKLKKYDFALDIWEGRLDKNAIDYMHENGIEVNAWTCDDKDRAEQLISWGIDYITTDILQAL